MVHDGQSVADRVGLLHIVGGQQDSLALGVQLTEDLPQGDAALGVKAGRGLVEEQDRRTVQEGPGHHEPFCHAA